MVRIITCENGHPKSLWAEVLNIENYVLNICLIKPFLKKTPYEVVKGKEPNVSYFETFRKKCFIHNNGIENLGKFDPRSDEGIFVGYSSVCKAYRVYSKYTMVIKKSIHVVFDETNNGLASSSSFDEFQLSKYVDDEDEGTLDKCNHQKHS